MQISISPKTLATALGDIAPFANKNKYLPIFSNVKVVTKGNKIRLQTSDGETSIRKYIEADSIDCDGEFLVDCASLNSYIQRVTVNGGVVTLLLDDNTLKVAHSKGKAEFQTLPTDDFVEPEQGEDAIEITLPSSALLNLVSAAKNFVSNDDYRPMLKSIRAIVKNNTFTVCGTDTNMLFTDSTSLTDAPQDAEWNIEQCVFGSLLKACKENEIVVVRISSHGVSYRIGATTIFTPQTQGKYPDFNRVIPKSHSTEFTFKKTEMIDALHRVMLFTEENNLAKINVSYNSLEVSSQNLTKLSKNSEHMDCVSKSDIEFGVNATKFMECIKTCASEDVKIEMEDASRPIVIKDANNPYRTVLCMPMTVIK